MSKIMDAQQILADARNCVECASLAVVRDVEPYQRDAIQVVLGIASKKIGEADALLHEYRTGNAAPVSDSAKAETGINPKLAALAATFDKTRAEFARVLQVLEVAEQHAWNNPEDEAAQAALKKAEDTEPAACEQDDKMIERLSEIVASNLDELKLKARFVQKGDVDDCLAESIVRDLRALA